MGTPTQLGAVPATSRARTRGRPDVDELRLGEAIDPRVPQLQALLADPTVQPVVGESSPVQLIW